MIKKLLVRDVLAIFGAHDLSNAYEAGRTLLSPKNIFIHDEWNRATRIHDADISLLQFEEGSIAFSEYIQPICIWNSDLEANSTEGMVVGWDRSYDKPKAHENFPKLITAPIKRSDLCSFVSGHRTFCTDLKNDTNACQGDSGEGFFIKVNDIYHLKGIVSTSLIEEGGFFDVSKNTVYTNVPKFINWIEKITKSRNTGLRSVSCVSKPLKATYLNRTVDTCEISEAVERDDYVLVSPSNIAFEFFYILNNKDVKFLPKDIGEKIPNLKEFWAKSCSLSVVRNFYFKNMRNLQYLVLNFNQIESIESDAFIDLIRLKSLWLHDNKIQTLDKNCFSSMVNVEAIYLDSNKIKFLDPETFKILGGKLSYVDLQKNECTGRIYRSDYFQLNQLEYDLKNICTKNAAIVGEL